MWLVRFETFPFASPRIRCTPLKELYYYVDVEDPAVVEALKALAAAYQEAGRASSCEVRKNLLPEPLKQQAMLACAAIAGADLDPAKDVYAVQALDLEGLELHTEPPARFVRTCANPRYFLLRVKGIGGVFDNRWHIDCCQETSDWLHAMATPETKAALSEDAERQLRLHLHSLLEKDEDLVAALEYTKESYERQTDHGRYAGPAPVNPNEDMEFITGSRDWPRRLPYAYDRMVDCFRVIFYEEPEGSLGEGRLNLYTIKLYNATGINLLRAFAETPRQDLLEILGEGGYIAACSYLYRRVVELEHLHLDYYGYQITREQCKRLEQATNFKLYGVEIISMHEYDTTLRKTEGARRSRFWRNNNDAFLAAAAAMGDATD